MDSSIYRFDHVVFREIHLGWHSVFLDPAFLTLSWLGLGVMQGFLSLALLWVKDMARCFLPVLITIVLSGLLVAQGTKHLLVDRDRPSNLPWAHPQELIYGNSFPSGHSTTSFAIATMLFLMTRGTKRAWVAWPAYLVALLIGLSRIYRGVHWPTDVIAGAGAGTMTSCILYLCLGKLTRLPDDDGKGLETGL